MKQTQFWKNPEQRHGGNVRAGKRKIARPIVTKSPMHLTFKSSRAKGAWSLHRQHRAIEAKVREIAKRYRVRLRLYQNVGNHLHLVTQAASRREFQSFLRVLPQAVMFLVTGARKGNAQGRFWDALVFSRVVHWGKDWDRIKSYVGRNGIEAAGIPRAQVDRWFREAQDAWRGG